MTAEPKQRAPRVGDLWLRPDSHDFEDRFVHVVGVEDGMLVLDTVQLSPPTLLECGWTLVATGARTVAEREAAGDMPDVSDDDRTPLERMRDERDAETQALFAEERHHTETVLKLKWARAFAASQGRVIAELRERVEHRVTASEFRERREDIGNTKTIIVKLQGELNDLRATRKHATQTLIAAIGSVGPENVEEAAMRAAERIASLKEDMSDAFSSGRASAGTDLAEALDALKGMVGDYVDHGTGIYPDSAADIVALHVLAKHGIVSDVVADVDGLRAEWKEAAE